MDIKPYTVETFQGLFDQFFSGGNPTPKKSIPSSKNVSDMQAALNMMAHVTLICQAIECDNPVDIDLHLKALNQTIKEFEALFRDNLIHERYKGE